MMQNKAFFPKKLIYWYLENKRDLPWRGLTDPYRIWLSEIMLQQTRVAQGTPYYFKFTEAFPTIKDLANAPEDEVLKLWQGLGYYSRARNLHTTAKYIAYDLNGRFPNTFEELLELKGVGDYTASAIGSICFDLPTAVVDGNVYRVLSRIFGISTPINSPAGIKEFKKCAQELLDQSQPGTFNQALMEFGARHCKPQKPFCETCPFDAMCIAKEKNKIAELPVKLKKVKVRKRYFNYVVLIAEGDKTILEQRTKKGIWQNLYQFPLIESEKNISIATLKKTEDFQQFEKEYNIDSVVLYNDKPIIHKLSHQHLNTNFWIVYSPKPVEKGTAFSAVKKAAVPVLISNFISQFPLFK